MKNWLKKHFSAPEIAPTFEGGLKKSLSFSGSGWNPLFVHEPYTGAWQKNDEKCVSAGYIPVIWSCISLISKDIGKMGLLLKKLEKGVMILAKTPRELKKILKKPNSYQTWQQFNEYWTTSLLLRGNAFIFISKDVYGAIDELHILHPDRVRPVISQDGKKAVFYRLYTDHLCGTEMETVPASEIIHDRVNCHWHPLVGLSPIIGAAVVAGMDRQILENMANLHRNGANPGGIISLDGPVDDDKVVELQEAWNARYRGGGTGGTAVLTDGAKYTHIGMTAVDTQVVEILEWSEKQIAMVFHVPLFKLGLADIRGEVEDLNEIYFSDCLQAYVEAREYLLDEALNSEKYGIEIFLDIDALIRMNKTRKISYLKTGVTSGILSPNEARQELGYLPVSGGDSPMAQQQNYSLEALAKRDAKEDPFSNSKGDQS